MRFVTWFLTAALLISWPELTAALADTALWAVQSPPVLVLALFAVGLHQLGQRVQRQATRGWAS